jgi:hypothetical protein
MDKMGVLMKWWADPERVIIPAGETDRIIDWLSHQSPETWHQVVLSWNYDYGDRVLTWILTQEQCDKGTAARVFLVEGLGHWLGDENLANNASHVCRVVLDHWHRYQTNDLKHGMKVPEDSRKWWAEADRVERLYGNSPVNEILNFEGTRDASSKFTADDGKIVIALEYWMEENGIEISA